MNLPIEAVQMVATGIVLVVVTLEMGKILAEQLLAVPGESN